MRYLMVWLALLPAYASAQELSVEDRACITAAAAKLPPVTTLRIEGSRVVAQPSAQGQRNSKLYHRQGGNRRQRGRTNFNPISLTASAMAS